MKLQERLIRGGLVFILFGTVAALLPENGSAMAVQTTYNNVVYTFGTTNTDTLSGATLSGNSAYPLAVYSGTTPSNGTTSTAVGSITQTGGTNYPSTTPFAVTVTSANQISVKRGTSSSGDTIVFTATFANDPTYHPKYTITH